ncbi:hypothetical protein [Streptomyces sp. NPDC048392]|uniref:hypothetical protein n=1 Tax=Streptomyces sp. NPDC048392 TaxID=3365543 RepID=UPI00371A494A
MAYTRGTTEGMRSQLIDLTDVPLDELGQVGGLSDALSVLRGQLAHTGAPLCEGSMAAMCGGTTRRG